MLKEKTINHVYKKKEKKVGKIKIWPPQQCRFEIVTENQQDESFPVNQLFTDLIGWDDISECVYLIITSHYLTLYYQQKNG